MAWLELVWGVCKTAPIMRYIVNEWLLLYFLKCKWQKSIHIFSVFPKVEYIVEKSYITLWWKSHLSHSCTPWWNKFLDTCSILLWTNKALCTQVFVSHDIICSVSENMLHNIYLWHSLIHKHNSASVHWQMSVNGSYLLARECQWEWVTLLHTGCRRKSMVQ